VAAPKSNWQASQSNHAGGGAANSRRAHPGCVNPVNLSLTILAELKKIRVI
jgi:hypothetical protein